MNLFAHLTEAQIAALSDSHLAIKAAAECGRSNAMAEALSGVLSKAREVLQWESDNYDALPDDADEPVFSANTYWAHRVAIARSNLTAFEEIARSALALPHDGGEDVPPDTNPDLEEINGRLA